MSKPQWLKPRLFNFHLLKDCTIVRRYDKNCDLLFTNLFTNDSTTLQSNSWHINYIFSKIRFFHKISHINLVEFSVAKNSSKVIRVTICFAGCAGCSNINGFPPASNNISCCRVVANYSSGISVGSSGPSGCTTSNL